MPSGCRRHTADVAAEPVIKLARLHNDYRTRHARVVRAAVLGAEQVIRSRCRGFKPKRGVTAGHDVSLGSKCGHEEVVNNVFGRHDQFDLSSHWYVQLVDLAVS